MNDIFVVELYNSSRICIVSIEDALEVSKYKWRLDSDRRYIYSTTKIGNSLIALHTFILGKSESWDIIADHKNKYTNDNTRRNLEYVTRSINNYNRKLPYYSTKTYRGVARTTNSKFWEVRLKKDKKVYRIGKFMSEKEAAIAYNFLAVDLYKERALLNEVNL